MTTFIKFDAGEGIKLRHKKADCTVRALATAKKIKYGDAYELLHSMQYAMRHCHFEIFDYLRKFPQQFQVKAYLHFPAKAGQRRMTVGTFAKQHPSGDYLLQAAHHATTIRNGIIYDTWNCSNRAVYAAWEF
jgi:hypothetical protein